MRTELGEIINAILTQWERLGHIEASSGLKKAPKGASSGTEGLLMMLEYLTEIDQTHPKLIDLVQVEMSELIEYCSNNGIQVNDSLSKRSFFSR